jgi:cobalt-zinc-cadmium efflux system protein
LWRAREYRSECAGNDFRHRFAADFGERHAAHGTRTHSAGPAMTERFEGGRREPRGPSEHGPGPHDHGPHDHGPHDHGQTDHGGHSHQPSATADARLLWATLALISAFLVAEVIVGLVSGSVALLSDAAHMLTDAGALVLAIVAMRLAARPATARLTYGWKRIEILSAQANGFTLLALAVVLVVASGGRLVHPTEVAGGPVLVTALVGIVVNIGASLLLARADRRSMNVQGAFQHVLTDLFAFIATAVSGVVVLLTGFTRADPLAALVVAALMVRAGLGLVRDAGRVIMEAAPVGVDAAEIGAALSGLREVADVHDLHVWEVTSGLPALSAHLLVVPAGDCHQVQRDARDLLRDRWHINHVTLQVDHTEPTLVPLTIGTAPRGHCAVPRFPPAVGPPTSGSGAGTGPGTSAVPGPHADRPTEPGPAAPGDGSGPAPTA